MSTAQPTPDKRPLLLPGIDPAAPTAVDGFWQPRRAAFWLYVMFVANGLFSIGQIIFQGYRVVPTTVVVGVLVWALYALVPLLFFRALDLYEQHPPLGFVMAFVWGGVAATYLAIPLNAAVQSVAAKVGSADFAQRWGPALAGPVNEETLKLIGVIVLVMIARSQFRGILAAVVIGATVGLGFQVVEDLVYTVNTGIEFPNTDQVAPVLLMLLVRGIFSGLFSHAMYTSIAAFGIGYYLTRPDQTRARRLLVALLAYLTAVALHFFWNSPWLTGLSSGIGGVLLQTVIKGIPVMVVGWLIWRMAGREEGTQLREVADYYLGDDLMTTTERESLGSLNTRRLMRKQVRKEHGRKASRALHRLQRGQLHLIRVLEENGIGRPSVEAANEVSALRQELTRLTT
ncbi:PrsW family intramembrane metalloprotease [Streptomyces sp. NPDC048330]|uniref:PrsW family intramembrane metalloprotease n=1 Tax=Streptomyces sp. NPDC048330 TaxID=3365533 RepID=UPI00371B930F